MIKQIKSELYNLPDQKIEVRLQFEITQMSDELEQQLNEKVFAACYEAIKNEFDPAKMTYRSVDGAERVFREVTDQMARRLFNEKYQEVISKIDMAALVNTTLLKAAERISGAK